MAHSRPAAQSRIDRTARELGCFEIVDIARAVDRHADSALEDETDRTTRTLAALRLAAARGGTVSFDLEAACAAVDGDADPDAVAATQARLESTLQPPASPDEIRRLRRAVITLRELVAAHERGRENAPYRPGSSLAGVDPALAGLLERPVSRLDGDALARHLERLEADLEMARLGVDLYAMVHGA